MADEEKRRFFKHLALIGAAGALGLTLARLVSVDKTDALEEYSDAEISRGAKNIWEGPEAAGERATEFSSGGYPYINEVACAYDIDNQPGVFCSSPCSRICPVGAITLQDNGAGKIVPAYHLNDCIGCGKCFRICGYNAIDWVNTRPVGGRRGRGGGGNG